MSHFKWQLNLFDVHLDWLVKAFPDNLSAQRVMPLEYEAPGSFKHIEIQFSWQTDFHLLYIHPIAGMPQVMHEHPVLKGCKRSKFRNPV